MFKIRLQGKGCQADNKNDMSMERFGELLLMERLASGGMAEVFRAKQLGYAGFEKTVAVKRILPHFASSEDFKNMFRLEANLSAMLQHTNITQVFSNGEHDSYLYLVMEFVDGKNLRQLLARADKVKLRIPIEVSCYIVSEALKGLDYAHNYHDERTGEALNIVHRDVSPQNIMLGYEGSVKVVDFGIAKAASKSESTRAGVLKGKFGYMSPEQARGESLDKRSDIFSMGIILWELITQRRLFTYEDELKTLEKVRECKVPRPSEKNPTIPYALEKIVMHALEKDPNERYSSGSEFYSDLVRYMNDRHPNFIATDFQKFMKDFYKEEIAEEKKRRERLNLEAPAFMAENPAKKSNTSTKKDKTSTKTDNGTRREADTQVSGVNDPNEDAATAAAPSSEAEPQDLRDTLNQDPSAVGATANRATHTGGLSKKISVVASVNNPKQTLSTFQQKPVEKTGMKVLRAVVVIVLLASVTYGALNYLPQMLGPQFASIFHQVADAEKKDVAKKDDPKTNADNPVQTDTTPEATSTAATPAANTTDRNIAEDISSAASVQREPDSVSVFVWEPRNYPNYGTVSLNAVPDADVIFINGKKFVDNTMSPIKTPLKDIKLQPGNYELLLKNTVFGVSKTVSVTVEQNKSTKLEAILNKR